MDWIENNWIGILLVIWNIFLAYLFIKPQKNEKKEIESKKTEISTEHRRSIIYLENKELIVFDDAVEMVANITKSANDATFIIQSFVQEKEGHYYYYAHLLIDLVKKGCISLYKKHPSGKEYIKVLKIELKGNDCFYKDCFIEKPELENCLISQRKLFDKNEELHKRMSEIEASGFTGREYDYLKEDAEAISKKLFIHFSE